MPRTANRNRVFTRRLATNWGATFDDGDSVEVARDAHPQLTEELLGQWEQAGYVKECKAEDEPAPASARPTSAQTESKPDSQPETKPQKQSKRNKPPAKPAE